ncbi:PREDICTED: uncharacterized protein LOC105147881 isoform X1 [Acromyrmex echinatior]|uniref:uncharacterized protein LOC105147881 isoform X1 n=1 Tax=Acromyrmex echinatior TaxID=103372 RepID=UPI000580D5A0|nr:PREDICTED: uncharacterized protein LOC105147881 isoform X1 [Acromyrmex echinatior]
MFVLSGSQNQKIQKISRILEDEEQLIFHANIHSDNCSSQDQLSEFNKENEALPCFNPSNRSTIRMNHSQEYNKKRKEYRNNKKEMTETRQDTGKRCETRVKQEENERNRDDSENERRPEIKRKRDEIVRER